MNLTEEQMLSIVWNGLDKSQSPKKVVVVGAGMSGLVAASLLKQAGHQVIILEANTIVGGRVRTLRDPFSDNLYGEAGAMRIPSFHKLVFAYIEKFGLPTNEFIDEIPENYIFVNGIKTRVQDYQKNPALLKYPVNEFEKGKTADDLLNQGVQPIIDFINSDRAKNWPLVLERFDRYSVRTFLKNYTLLSEGAIETIGVLLDEEEIMMTSFIESIRDQTDITPTNTYFEITGGNDRLPAAFLPEVAENIVYNARITKIEQDNQSVTLHYINPVTREESHVSGDLTIITIPFSALRFVELKPLESFRHEKLKAIRELHYDTSTKILLEFKSRFWEKEGQYGGNTATDLPIRFTYYPSHGIGKPGPAVLLASYTWGDDALRWDSLTREDRIYYALRNLAMIYGEKVHQEFVKGVSHSWLEDEYTLGAFALFEPEQQTELYNDIYTPEGRVHFAGEHTTLKHAWIEGAIESGIRVANEVNSLT